MLYKTILIAGLCVVLLALASCSAPEATTVEGGAEAENKEIISDNSEVIISLGDKKLTMQQIKWMQPDADNQAIAKIADWWLENELLCAEAERRGITSEPKAKFIAELMKRRAFSNELVSRVQDAAKISDEKVLDYYERNKDEDSMLKQPGYFNFSHIRTKTLEEAQAVLERVKAGEDINALARELSIYDDANKGGRARRYVYRLVERRFGTTFFESLAAAKEGELIGPIKVKEDAYEVVRHEGKIESRVLPFEKVKERIRSKLQRMEKSKVFASLVDSLRQEASDKIVRSPLLTAADKSAGGESKQGREK